MSNLISLKFPQAKSTVEVETVDDIIGYARVLQYGYGYKAEDVEVYGTNNDTAEIIKGHLCADDPQYKDNVDYTIKLSLPGSDLWFDANGDDIMYARILLNNCYGITMTPENTQIKVNHPEIQEIVDELTPKAAHNWKNFIWSAWHASWNYNNKYETLASVRKSLSMWAN